MTESVSSEWELALISGRALRQYFYLLKHRARSPPKEASTRMRAKVAPFGDEMVVTEGTELTLCPAGTGIRVNPCRPGRGKSLSRNSSGEL